MSAQPDDSPWVEQYVAVAGTDWSSDPLPVLVRSVNIDNHAFQWLQLKVGSLAVYIPPGQIGVRKALPGVTQIETHWLAPPGRVQPPAVAGQQALIVAQSWWEPDDPGVHGSDLLGAGRQGIGNPTINPSVVTTVDNPIGSTTILVPDTTPFTIGAVVSIWDNAGNLVVSATVATFVLNVNPGVSISLSAALSGDAPIGSTVLVRPRVVIDPVNSKLQITSSSGAPTIPTDPIDRPVRQLGAVSTPAVVGVAFASADRAIGIYNFDVPSASGVGLAVYITTGAVGAGNVTVSIIDVDTITGVGTRTVLASAPIAANGAVVLRVYPGIAAAANASADDIVGAKPRISCAVAGADLTFSVGYAILF